MHAHMKKLLPALALLALSGCGSEAASPSEALEPGLPFITVSGTIEVTGTTIGGDDDREVIVTFYEPGDSVAQAEFFLVWTGRYQISLTNTAVCSWNLTVTIWDGRESEALPLFEEPPPTCAGSIAGPTFRFPA